MKILWTTNVLIGYAYETIRGEKPSKSWMQSLLDQFIHQKDHELIIVSTYQKQQVIKKDNITYYLLPAKSISRYKPYSNKNKKIWDRIIMKEKPDILHIWGSEFRIGLSALMYPIPSVLYLQGIIETIHRYYYSGISFKDILFNITIHDLVKFDSIFSQKRRFFQQVKYENLILKKVENIICENNWSIAHVKKVNENLTIYKSKLIINDVYRSRSWDINKIERFSILVNASGYPIKGLHMLIKAINLLREKYPDIKVYVPGVNLKLKKGLKGLIHNSNYMKIINSLIKKFKLQDVISFIGYKQSEELAAIMSKTHVFVMPSSIENHSSTLKEAMTVGVPSIASNVGGISEYLTDGYNGLLYRFEEYEMLAELINTVFSSDILANKLSRHSIESSQGIDNSYNDILRIYTKIINKINKEDAEENHGKSE